MTPPNALKIGRLAMRQEGSFWNAYYAQTENMNDAILLGSIALRFVETPERRQAFMGIMRDAVGDLIEQATGVRPVWGTPKRAPESERSGNA